MKHAAAKVGVTLFCVLGAAGALAAQTPSSDGVWAAAGLHKKSAAAAPHVLGANRGLQLRAYGRYTVNGARLKEKLGSAPMEFSRAPRMILLLPMPDGKFERVAVEESPIFSPALQARYHEVRTYTVRGVDDTALTGRLDHTPAGFHGMLFSKRGIVFIDPADGSASQYVSYWKGDAVGEAPVCDTHRDESSPSLVSLGGVSALRAAIPAGGQLREYRLAVSVTGQYTRFFDGTPPTAGTPLTVAQIATTINRVSGVYEREVAVRLRLTATRIFDDPAADPFPDPTPAVPSPELRPQNQTELDTNVGDANYDIGHVFSQGGTGGVANLATVCVAGSKARGQTSRANPSGDPFDVDFVAHEIGHQFGGNHTWTSNTNACADAAQFVAAAAFEPGSGSTIMSYAGICSPQDVQANSDAYFHTRNFDEIMAFRTTGAGSTCGTLTNTGNNPPVANAGPDCTIPQSTPFTLTAAASSDPDGDALTFVWEQFDAGTHGQIPQATNTTGPMFRSRPATAAAARTFPPLADLLSGAATPWEVLPSVNRTMNFRATARDNRAGGGGVDNDDTVVTVSGPPFNFSAPASGSSLQCGASNNIAWNVGGGGIAPAVRLDFSTDDGASFAALVGNTVNDGAEAVTLLRTLTTQGRMRLVPSTQCFFALSPRFSIVDTLVPSIAAPATVTAECTGPAGTAVAIGTASASDQCDLTPTVTNNAPGVFPLGTTSVVWTATDDSANQAQASQSVVVQDTTAPTIFCNAPATIVPSQAPISFTAGASDVCDTTPSAAVTAFRCYDAVKGIDKSESCVVSFGGSRLTVADSGGINNVVEWTVRSVDGSGNVATKTCSVQVVKKK